MFPAVVTTRLQSARVLRERWGCYSVCLETLVKPWCVVFWMFLEMEMRSSAAFEMFATFSTACAEPTSLLLALDHVLIGNHLCAKYEIPSSFGTPCLAPLETPYPSTCPWWCLITSPLDKLELHTCVAVPNHLTTSRTCRVASLHTSMRKLAHEPCIVNEKHQHRGFQRIGFLKNILFLILKWHSLTTWCDYSG